MMHTILKFLSVSDVLKYFMFGQVVLHYIHQENP